MPHKHATILLFAIIIAVICAILSGWYWGEKMLMFQWVGTLFLNALKMMIIPLIVSAVISGLASFSDMEKLRKLGGITILYYLTTTSIAVLIGLFMVNIIKPGEGLNFEHTGLDTAIISKKDIGISDIILSMVPQNIFASAVEMKILPIIVFSIFFSIALIAVGKRAEVVVNFFDALNEIMMKMVIWIMYLAPIGIFSLIATRLAKSGGGEAFYTEIKAVGLHVVTVLSGLFIHFIFLFLLLLLFTRYGLSYMFGMLRAILTAFGTASSSATLPITMECARENNIDERAIRFVLPLGSTVNMDGTALYEAAAVMFIAQAYGIDMSIGKQAIIFITSTLAAIGAAGIPEAGLVTMIIVLNAVGLPIEAIGLLLSVDWFLDRFRTSINVWGDSVGAAVVHKYVENSSE
ncbi:MAG: dicarboxylate/amino acid:cation symporter [Nitrospirae bacterium]|nr:MAG: dicarboxylate/amino acid:cation symporter [Nitrospirota bacterium]